MTPEEFRAARESMGLTQPQMAAALGYSAKARISEIERRHNDVPEPVALAVRAMLILGPDPALWPDDGQSIRPPIRRSARNQTDAIL